MSGEQLQQLWDEANVAAGELVCTAEAAPCLSLLKRMQDCAIHMPDDRL
jgi:hypothetical protein